jgi:hypothetical protein
LSLRRASTWQRDRWLDRIYLGDFYRGVAVRYALMAQEASERTKKEIVRAEHWFSRQVESDLARLATPTRDTPHEAQ